MNRISVIMVHLKCGSLVHKQMILTVSSQQTRESPGKLAMQPLPESLVAQTDHCP